MPAGGQGSLSASPKVDPQSPPGPPFPANSAYNGLSVDPVTGQIVFGNDTGSNLADFVNNREINTQDFTVTPSTFVST